MKILCKLLYIPHYIVMKAQALDFLAPLALRVFLIPIFWMAGTEKWNNIESTAEWFGNPDWGLGLPAPLLMAYLASITEIIGAVCLTLGLAVRYITVPLLVTMLVAIFFVHFDNGWFAIATHEHQSAMRLVEFLDWLQTTYPIKYDQITELGRPVILNNGIEFGVTYAIMLVCLFFYGGGNYISCDYWISKYFPCPKIKDKH